MFPSTSPVPSNSKVIICAAGGGKTSRIVAQALSEAPSRSLIVTYTRNNEKEIGRRLYAKVPVIPGHIEVMTWFVFLLRELARPYRRVLHDRRIEGLQWVEGRSVQFVPQSKVSAHYFAGGTKVYSDKLSKFICECDRLSNGAVMRRLSQRFDHIFVDEVQDMAGYDLDVLELMLKAGIRITLVGDHRQATFRTNQASKHKAFVGVNIVKLFQAWSKAALVELSYEQETHRCSQAIADIGDGFFPDEPRTKSNQVDVTGHDGVFVVPTGMVAGYVQSFSPQILRLDRRTNCHGYAAMNFGESKGLTFDRVLIFPHGGAKEWLKTGQIGAVEKVLSKMYVGATRARYSLAFVYDGAVGVAGLTQYKGPE